jgi:hypothetical protein
VILNVVLSPMEDKIAGFLFFFFNKKMIFLGNIFTFINSTNFVNFLKKDSYFLISQSWKRNLLAKTKTSL